MRKEDAYIGQKVRVIHLLDGKNLKGMVGKICRILNKDIEGYEVGIDFADISEELPPDCMWNLNMLPNKTGRLGDFDEIEPAEPVTLSINIDSLL